MIFFIIMPSAITMSCGYLINQNDHDLATRLELFKLLTEIPIRYAFSS